jgi:energy-coupling factor transporter ATP-binding protein EcfA2
MSYIFRIKGTGEKQAPPYFYLATDRWNDFGYRTQFHLTYVNQLGQEERVGAVKILKKTQGPEHEVDLTTALPESFNKLEESYISLGQSESYYKDLFDLLGTKAGAVLEALNDIAWQPSLARDFEPTPAYRNSLIRENGAQLARRFGREWVLGIQVRNRVAFSYCCHIEGAELPLAVHIDFNGKDELPGRVVGIIGRNAVGKTRFLANLAIDLTQISRTSTKAINRREERFPYGRPLFTRVLAVSYSAFDRFRRPAPEKTMSYMYCGIRSEQGSLSRTSLVNSYKRNQIRIHQLERQSEWARHVKTILGDLSEDVFERLSVELEETSEGQEPLSLLSSGQAMLCHFVTAVLAWIEPKSLVLFDEPETHLHPNAVASLFVVLTDILRSYDSYAVIATHSPVVIQEIPGKRVVLFRREASVTTAEPLGLESFGESVTELTRHVFETIEVESLYRKTLRDLARDEEFADVVKLFENGLSLNAKAYLLAQYAASDSE